jgi:quercetin dioxygenase-like cupin family protein
MKRIPLLLLTVCLTTQAWAFKQKEVTSEVLAQTTMSWNGATLPAYPNGQPQITVLKITIPPKTVLQWHEHPVINAGYIVSGSLKVETTTNEVLYLNQGDTIVEVVNTWHRGINETRKPVVFYAGAIGTPITVVWEE